jgi:hypothetical protein
MSPTLEADYKLLTSSALYLKSFSCAEKDLSIIKGLTKDLEEHAASGKTKTPPLPSPSDFLILAASVSGRKGRVY